MEKPQKRYARRMKQPTQVITITVPVRAEQDFYSLVELKNQVERYSALWHFFSDIDRVPLVITNEFFSKTGKLIREEIQTGPDGLLEL